MPKTYTTQTTVYQIDEHPDKDKVFNWIRENWLDLDDYCRDEANDSLNAFCDDFNIELGYHYDSVFILDCPVEFKTMTGIRAWKWLQNHGYFDLKDCPYTGVCYDESLLDPIRKFKRPADYSRVYYDTYSIKDLLSWGIQELENDLEKAREDLYSDEALLDMCQSNEYEFTEDGGIY